MKILILILSVVSLGAIAKPRTVEYQQVEKIINKYCDQEMTLNTYSTVEEFSCQKVVFAVTSSKVPRQQLKLQTQEISLILPKQKVALPPEEITLITIDASNEVYALKEKLINLHRKSKDYVVEQKRLKELDLQEKERQETIDDVKRNYLRELLK